MIEMAQKKVTGDNPEFHVAGFESIRTLRKSFRNSDFDTVSCIGNTLVHLPDIQAISDSFAAVYDILKPGGMYIVQIVNYDRILKEKVSSLPPLKGGNAALQRLYSIVEGGKAVQFEIQLTINEGSGEQIFEDHVRLLPLGSGQLVDIAESAGFSETGLYGNYQEDPYSPESSATIATLQKK
jgi:SAM-dependent methyltransferase